MRILVLIGGAVAAFFVIAALLFSVLVDPNKYKNEFALLVKAGLTPAEALASATTVAAKTLGMENEIGRIAVGYSADLVAVSENPLTNITPLEKPTWVMVRGRIVP